MRVIVVTGTNTGVGKTVVTAALASCAQAAGQTVAVVKPVQTGVGAGADGDLAEVGRLSRATDQHEYARFDEPLAPGTAARRLGVAGPGICELAAQICALDDRDLVLVEGAGGPLVELNAAGGTLVELAAVIARAAPVEVLLVASAGLGVLNVAALTARVLADAGLPLAGVVVGDWPAEPDLAARCNLLDLPRYASAELLGVVPAGTGALGPAGFAAIARESLAPRFGGHFDAATFVRRASEPSSARTSPPRFAESQV